MAKPRAKVSVRPWEPSDSDAIYAIAIGKDVLPTTMTVPSTSRAAMTERYGKPEENRHQLVAEVEGVVVGFGGLLVVARPRGRHAAHLYVEVHQDFHGRGVGTAIMQALVDLADRWLGLVRIQLECNADNARAIALYERFGFETEGRLRGNILRDGEYVDSVVMGRLRPSPALAAPWAPRPAR